MRRMLLSAVAVVGGVAPGFAQSPAQQLGTVTAAEVTLRAAPKADAPDAGQLFRGLDVIVHHAEGDDWLAIQPPPGTISWINHKFVAVAKDKGFPQNAVVNSDGEVKLAAGRAGVNKPLDTRKTAVPDGTVVRVLAAGVKTDEDGSVWYPIQPLKGRLPVRAKGDGATRRAGDRERCREVADEGDHDGGRVVGEPDGRGAGEGDGVPEQAGRVAEHERHLERGRDGRGGEGVRQGGEVVLPTGPRDERGRRRHRPGQPVLHPHPRHPRARPRGPGREGQQLDGPEGETPKADAKKDEWTKRDDGGAAKPTWTGAGTLRLASVRSKDKPYYALEDSRGNLLYYAVSGSNGIDLEKYAKKKVDLFGTVSYPPELRYGVVTVTRVDAAK